MSCMVVNGFSMELRMYKQRGLTLIEMMIVISIVGIIISIAAPFFVDCLGQEPQQQTVSKDGW